MAIYREDIINIELESGTIYRSFLHHSIGGGDELANRFGVRLFRNGQPENVGGTCTGYFVRHTGETIVITNGTVLGNVAFVTLPEACYAVEGGFSLAIKCQGGGITGTMRIVDGVVSRTSTSTPVDPGDIMPRIEELIEAIEEAEASLPTDYTTLIKNYRRQIREGFLQEDIAYPPYEEDMPLTRFGITYTLTEDGKIHAVGTASESSNFYVRENFAIDENIKKVHLDGCPAGGGENTYRISLAKYNGERSWSTLISDNGNGADYIIKDQNITYTLVCRIAEGQTVDIVFDPLLCDAEKWSNKKISEDVISESNLISFPYTNSSINRDGVKAYSLGDGRITMESTGESETNNNFYIVTDFSFPPEIRKIRLEGCPQNENGKQYSLRIGMYTPEGSGITGWSTIGEDTGDGVEVEILPDAKYLIAATAYQGEEFSLVTFNPHVSNAYSVSIQEMRDKLYDKTSIHFTKINSSYNYRGDCAVIAGKVNGIVDFGYDPACVTLINKLKELRIKKLDFVVVSHYHADHITNNFPAAMDALIEAGIDFTSCVFYMPHKGVDWSQWIGEDDSKADVEPVVLNKLDTLGIKRIHPENNEVFVWNHFLSMRFFNIGDYTDYYSYTLGMNSDETGHTNYNSFSMVCEMTIFGKKVLFSGDVTPIAQDKCYGNIHGCDIYKVEHHGINNDSSGAWLNSLNPKYVIIPNYSNSYTDLYTATRKTVRYLSEKAAVYSTLDGNVVVTISVDGIEISGGMAVTVEYGSGEKDIIQEIAAKRIVELFDNEAVSIESAQTTYMEIEGKYVDLSGSIYFEMVIHCLSNINTGLGSITSSLPVPKNKSVVFREVSGVNDMASLSYSNGWRVNGRHNIGQYCYVAGMYEKELN